MATAGIVAQFSGSNLCSTCRPLISFQSNKYQFRFVKVSRRPIEHSFIHQKKSEHSFVVSRHIRCAASDRNGYQGLVSDSGVDHEPFWLSMIKNAAGSLRSLSIFLAEQPLQLKCIEWPTFQSTLKTATLTLVLVALLIVALSSIDSSLCYILTLLLRKTA